MLYKTTDESVQRASQFQQNPDQENETTGDVIVSRSSSTSMQQHQHPLPDKREALRLNNLPTSTPCAYVNHKVTLCKPITRSKAIACAPITFNRCTQTLLDDDDDSNALPPIGLLPIPVGLVTPLPLAMGTADCPVPVPIPIPVPFPLFFVVNDKKFDEYEEYLQKLKQIFPNTDEDAEMLAYAQTLFPNDDLLGLAKYNPKSSPLDEEPDDDLAHPRTTTTTTETTSNNQLDQEFSSPDNVLNKLAFDFEDFDLSTAALTGETNVNSTNGNPSEKIDYLMRQDDAKYILKWHFGVRLFRAWIESKNAPLRQRLFQQYTRVRRLSPADAELRLAKRLHRPDLLSYRADELNTALCLFLKEIRDVYDGDSIYYFCLGIQHYLRENRPLGSTRRHGTSHFYRTESIFFDATFAQFQSKLHSILVRFYHHRDPDRPLSLRGPSTSSTHDRPSRIEEELLWEAKQLGAHTPWILLNTILYFNTKYFFLKSVAEHQVLSFSNVRRHYKRNVGPHGEEYGKSVYLRYYPPSTTIHGMEEQQLIYEQAENYDDPLRCPVKLFEFYLTKCPESVKCRQDVLYLLPEATCVPDSPLWFSAQSLSASTMDHMLTRIKTVRDVNDIHLSMSQTSFDNTGTSGRS